MHQYEKSGEIKIQIHKMIHQLVHKVCQTQSIIWTKYIE